MKTRPVGAELFHAVGQTDRHKDMTNLIVAFRSFAQAPTMYTYVYTIHVLGMYVIYKMKQE